MNQPSATESSLLAAPTLKVHPQLEAEIKRSLALRLQNSLHYSIEEMEKVSQLNAALFPSGFELSEEDSNVYRVLARLSQCGLNTAAFSSHRPYLGPFIVGFKKIFWRLMRVLLKDTFEGLQELSSWLVINQAKQAAEIKELRQQLLAQKR